jgi:hypothetical protein
MLWAKADQIKKTTRCAALSAAILLGWTAAGFAQEPPLDIPSAGALAGLASSGCDAGLTASPYGFNSGLAANSGPQSTGSANSASDLNVPLYSNPLAGDNVPLYSAPNEGANAPLYSTSTANNYSGLYGGSSLGTRLSPVANSQPGACRSGIPLGEWLIYPSIRLYSLYSDNLFLAPTGGISATGFGATPSVTAQWTNGIHSTTISADVDTQQYPTDNLIDTFDRQATITQRYSPLPDLTFTALGNYSHQTVASSLTSSIPSVISTAVTTPTLLPNGNIELPNGEIVSPTGQVVGNISGPSGANGTSIVNPSDQYTGSATVSKIFNGGILTLSGSWAQTDYQFLQSPGTSSAYSSFATQTYGEDGSISLGPLFYAYSNGTFSMRTNGEGTDPYSQAYRMEGGIGTRQFGLFRSSIYGGYQGSNGDTSSLAGGLIYGGTISYYPTLAWTITAALNETINKASGGLSTQALAIASPVQIPLSSSTRITHPSLQTQYQIAPKWTAVGNFSYTQIYYYGSPRLDNAWQADAQLSYQMWRNMTLTWEYEYTDVVSNVPGTNAQRNYLMMSANYQF